VESFLTFVFSLAGLMAAAILSACWIGARPGSRTARRTLLSVLAFYCGASLYAVPYALSRVLARGFVEVRESDLPNAPLAIVVLGSGSPVFKGRDGTQLAFLDVAGAIRVLEAQRIYRLAKDPWVISSGGAANSATDAPTTGGSMRDALVRLGVPSDRVLLEDRSQSTRDEAVMVAPMLHQLSARHAVIVTSDYHMWRALAAFRSMGVDAVPAIAMDPMARQPWSAWLWPSNQALLFSGSVVREYLAIGAYWSRGWL
jgi:uncharacterized SAM-binding protein YcdF (DUF218 family)